MKKNTTNTITWNGNNTQDVIAYCTDKASQDGIILGHYDVSSSLLRLQFTLQAEGEEYPAGTVLMTVDSTLVWEDFNVIFPQG